MLSCINEQKSIEREVNVVDDNVNVLYEKYQRIMKEKNFSLKINGPCDDALIDEDHVRGVGYVEKFEKVDSSLVLEFKIKDACCKEFLGDYNYVNDTLFFYYEQINDIVCGCMCWYRYKLVLNDFNEKVDSVIIKPLRFKDITN